MARRIKISAGELNIRLHPHPEGIYGQFIEALFALRKPVRLRGDRWGMLSLLDRADAERGIYSGLIATFTKIDFDQPWFDSVRLAEAQDDVVGRIEIPPNIFPNANSFHFVFDANQHRMFVQSYSKGRTFSIRQAEKLIQGLASDLRITAEYGEAAINVVQSRAGLDRIFEIPVLKRLIFILNKPNADVFEDDFDERIEGYLQETHARQMKIELDAEPGQSIAPNESLRRVGTAALDNGSVVGEGRDGDGRIVRSSKDAPKEVVGRYDPEEEQEHTAFRGMVGR